MANSNILVQLLDKYGREIVNSAELTGYIANNSLSIDSDKLHGIDSFIIDAKRLKCTVNLPYSDSKFSNALKDTLTDSSLLLEDEMPVIQVPCIKISEQDAINIYSLASIWGTNYSLTPDTDDGTDCTWQHVDPTTFFIRSVKMQNMLSAAAWNYMYAKYRGDKNNYGQISQYRGYTVPQDGGVNFDIAFLNVVEFLAKGVMIWYKEEHPEATVTPSINNMKTYFIEYLDSIMPDAVDGDGLGTYINSMLEEYHYSYTYPYGSETTFNLGNLFIDAPYAFFEPGIVPKISDLVSHDINPNSLPNWWFENIHMNRVLMPKSIAISWYLFDHILKNIPENMPSFWLKVDNLSYSLRDYDEFSTNFSLRIAGFINSIIRYKWFNSIVLDYIASSFETQRLHSTKYYKKTNTLLFHKCKEMVSGILPSATSLPPTSSAVANPSIIYNNVNYNFFEQIMQYGTINALKPFIGETNNVSSEPVLLPEFEQDYADCKCFAKIGKPKTKTITTDIEDGVTISESGIQVILENPYPNYISDTDIYVPVRRIYKFANSPFYKFGTNIVPSEGIETEAHALYNPKLLLVDNFNYNKLSYTPAYQTLLIASGYTDQNWMYLDNFVIQETLYWNFNASHNNDIFEPHPAASHYPTLSPVGYHYRETIPVFDRQSGVDIDEYGMYIYKDYFNTYYTKERSSLMNVYVNVVMRNDNNTQINLYKGVVDFNTVSFTNNTLSFEAVDALGVLSENLKKLNNIVCFSQYDTSNTASDKAIVKSGTTLKQFIEGMIKYPLPYRTNLVNDNFQIADSLDVLNNKVLSELTAEEAFTMALQCSKCLLYVDNNGLIQIKYIDYDNASDGLFESYIDGDIISISTQNNAESELFPIEKISKLSGWQRFAPAIATYYNSLREKLSSQTVSISIAGQESDIKVLDKIWIDNICYLVTESSVDFRNRNGIGIR